MTITAAEAVAPRQYRQAVTAVPDAIAGIRRIVGAYVRLWGFAPLAEDAALCASELLSNVGKHAGSPACVLTLQQQPGGVRLTVSDASRELPVVREEPDWADEGGRGLQLLRGVAEAWGACPTEGGKEVWVEIRTKEAGAVTDKAPRRVCGERALLPVRLACAALELRPGAGPEDVERHLRCTLEAHATGDHHALVLDLDGTAGGPDGGAAWAAWTRGHAVTDVRVIPDCGAIGPAPGREPCCEYDGHPGGHTWQLADSWRMSAAAR